LGAGSARLGRSGHFELVAQDFREVIEPVQKSPRRSVLGWLLDKQGVLLDEQGRRDETHTTLAEIYNWFTEGFDAADLKDATALVDELGN
jgi:hypothetical protein